MCVQGKGVRAEETMVGKEIKPIPFRKYSSRMRKNHLRFFKLLYTFNHTDLEK